MQAQNRYFAICPLGLEAIAEQELQQLSIHHSQQETGGISFQSSESAMFRANIRARSITRIIQRLGQWKTYSWQELQQKSLKIHWENYLFRGQKIDLQASSQKSLLHHSQRIADTVQTAIKQRLEHHGKHTDKTVAMQKIMVRIIDGECSISIDTSGERLDRRGYRKETGPAPLRETIAAGLLQWAQWQPDEALSVPMCGAGTWPIEAYLQASHTAINQQHDFPLLHWPSLNHKRWQKSLATAQKMQKETVVNIEASDRDAATLAIAKRNAKRAGLAAAIQWQQQALSDWKPTSERGLMLCNPPYGKRLEAGSIFHQLGDLHRQYPQWRMLILCPNSQSQKALGCKPTRHLAFRSGGMPIHALLLDQVRG